MKPVAYISDGGVIFKEFPPDSILKLSPLYTSAEIQELHNLVKEQDKKIINLSMDVVYANRTIELINKESEGEMKQESVLWDEEEFNGRAHTYRTWPASDIKGVYDRFDELLNYVKKSTAPRELSDEEIKKVWSNLKCNRSDSIELIFARAILKKASEK